MKKHKKGILVGKLNNESRQRKPFLNRLFPTREPNNGRLAVRWCLRWKGRVWWFVLFFRSESEWESKQQPLFHGPKVCPCSEVGESFSLPRLICDHLWVVVSNIFYFHPYLGKIPILTDSFQRGWNHQLDLFWDDLYIYNPYKIMGSLVPGVNRN